VQNVLEESAEICDPSTTHGIGIMSFCLAQQLGFNIGFHFIFQSMWDSIVSTMIWLYVGRSASDLSLLQNIHTSHIAYTFSHSIGTTGSIQERRQGMSVTTHLHLM
jgi:hypothetical protein